MSGARGRDLLRHHYESDCFVADGEAGKACGQVIVTTDLSSSSLSAVDLSLDVGASDMDWGSSAHTSRYCCVFFCLLFSCCSGVRVYDTW